MSEELRSQALTPEDCDRIREINLWLIQDRRRVRPSDAAWLIETLERHGRRIPAKKRHGSPLGYAYEVRTYLGDPYGFTVESHTVRLAGRLRGKYSKIGPQTYEESNQPESKKQFVSRVHDWNEFERIARAICDEHENPHQLSSMSIERYGKKTGRKPNPTDKNLQRILREVRADWIAQNQP